MNSILAFIRNQTDLNAGTKNIVSYAFPIENIDFNDTLSIIKTDDIRYFYTSKPADKFGFLGIDYILEVCETGPDRVARTSDTIRNLKLQQISNFSDVGLNSVPLFLGGMKFSSGDTDDLWTDFSDSDWFIPKILFYENGGKKFVVFNFFSDQLSEQIISSYLTDYEKYSKITFNSEIKESCNVLHSNYDDPAEKDKWITQVKSALDQIRLGKFHKIVLSRQVNLEINCNPDFNRITRSLEKEYPRCYIFVFRKENSTFFGASPEKLAKISDGWVEADALAGSMRRGRTKEEDEKLAEELLASTKNLNEQSAVVDFITNSFESFSEEIDFNPTPIIRKLPNIQHLWTPIRAKLKDDKSILSILKDIHPTPAICGVPWTNALVSIKQMESHSRGLFAGMVGWFNFENEGEFAVAIRSALSRNNHIYALAGCGIVEGSDPEMEYREAELKLKPILSLFKNEEVYQS